jgi:hypothetical protein
MPWPGSRGYLELSDDAGSPLIAGVTHVTDTSCGPAAGTSCGFPLTLRAALHLLSHSVDLCDRRLPLLDFEQWP